MSEIIKSIDCKFKNNTYSKIFIIEDRNLWEQGGFECDKNTDLILCLDFALKMQLLSEGYQVEFLDHLVNNKILEGLNFEMHDFLDEWFKDENGKDLLTYKGFDLGDTHLLFMINEVDYFCHYFFNIIALKVIKHEKIFVSVNEELILSCLDKLELPYQVVDKHNQLKNDPVYLFPILKWISEKTQRTNSLSFKIKNTIANCFDFTFKVLDPILNRKKKHIYIQRYHPTNQIIKQLQAIKDIQFVFNNYTGLKNIWNERRIHFKHKKDSSSVSSSVLNAFTENRSRKWFYDKYPVSDYLYEIIDKILEQKLPSTIDTAESIYTFFQSNKIDLMVPVTNLWVENRLVMNYCKKNNIPVFTIINGLLSSSFFNDSKDSDYVNCYSESIKMNYFENADNAYPLGDPRMDHYVTSIKKDINYINPTIIIGAAGFNPIDLNSYLAFEFDFLFDILINIEKLSKSGKKSKVILKVRGNGYVNLYNSFINEYFNDLDIEIIQDQSFSEVIKEADLYISFYSQTLFEASCLGIPVIYYKKDTQFLHKPFDNNSELTTAINQVELMELFKLFFAKDAKFEKFKSRHIMEKYVGYLDGKNVERNVDFIVNLIK